MTSQKLNLGNYGITLHTQEEQDEKSPLVKNESFGAVGAKWRGYITTVMPWWRHINPSNIGLDGDFIRICMKSSEHNGTYISLPICINQADLWQEDFFIFFLLNMSTIPICDLRLLFSFPSTLYQPHIQPWNGNQHELIGWWRMWNKGTFLRCFHIVFQRPYRYFSIALKVILSLSDRFKSFTNDWL